MKHRTIFTDLFFSLPAVLMVLALFSGGQCVIAGSVDSLAIRYAGESAHLPAGSDIVALGETGVVLPRHVVSSLWNPSAPAFLGKYEISGEYADLYGGMSMQGCAGLMLPFSGGLGASVLYMPFMSGPIDRTDTLRGASYQDRQLHPDLRADGSSLGTFENNHHLVMVSIAKLFSLAMPRMPAAGFPLPLDIGAGFSFKSSWQSMNPGNVTNYGMNVNLDAGIMARAGLDYDLGKKRVSRQVLFGMAVRDFLPSPVIWIRSRDEYNAGREYQEPIAPTVISGISYVDKSGDFGGSWTLSAGIRRQYALTYHYGIEVEILNLIAFRGGLSNRIPSFGAGVRYKNIFLDYAFRFDEFALSPVRLTIGYQY